MICDAILTFVLVFVDGHVEGREKWLDSVAAEQYVTLLTSDSLRRQYLPEISNVKNIKVFYVEPYDCFKGPNK